nr:uncharacterized protein LOC129144570 isoform X2 [Pan troglodytes]
MAGSLVFGPVELRVWCPLLRPVFSARLHVTPPLPPWTWDLQVLEGPLGRCRDSTEDNHGAMVTVVLAAPLSSGLIYPTDILTSPPGCFEARAATPAYLLQCHL